MKDILRDSTVGQFVNYVSGGGLLPYPEQRSDFVIPERYLARSLSRNEKSVAIDVEIPDENNRRLSLVAFPANVDPVASQNTLVREPDLVVPIPVTTDDPEQGDELEEKKRDGLAKAKHDTAFGKPEIKPQYELVEWYGPDDSDNPRNWSLGKRCFVAFMIGLLTFSVYTGSAIYTSSIPNVIEAFGVSQTMATLGLTLYVLAYGIGPMFLTPWQEIPSIGRNPVYIACLALFVVLNVPIIEAKNINTLLAFRFLTGFVGSPALATGGASMADVFPSHQQPYVIGIWGLGAQCGPILGPVIGGFAAQANGWKWPIYELMWITGFTLIFLTFLLPETMEANILLKRAQRLRKLTGNENLRSQSEIDMSHINKKAFLYETLVQPFVLAFEPTLLFANVFLGLVYSVFYLWFEAFPLVFNDMYGFNLGVGSLPYLAFIVSGATAYTVYCFYITYHLNPREKRDGLIPEARLEIGLMASVCIPISLFMFGWSSRPSVHWMVPIVAAGIYVPGIFLTFQSILMYVALSYPKHVGAVFASNDMFRSSMASVFPLFGAAFFRKLGFGPGSSLLAGISIILIGMYYLLIRYGNKLRARSRYAN